ncbi:hypothetical protein BX661DRAFT_182396 [Kickxella alabastrina]|uniref:uncharacterized protein n=1 Tax=Kickxella alabastrina TaxID=61397 RepID=UPI00221E8B25|nr:uncharacterized protein BX661DRAFT_182396 [Kickxella alabastrina]KAI7827762.1 hypothetical protein BX661DRAFT_182396 [Kickxella alabastrina]
MALWRQESGLGPPSASASAAKAPASVSKQHSVLGYPPTTALMLQAQREAGSEREDRDIQPHIYVPRQPLFAHGAMMMDTSGEYICEATLRDITGAGGRSNGAGGSSDGSGSGRDNIVVVCASIGPPQLMRCGSGPLCDDDEMLFGSTKSKGGCKRLREDGGGHVGESHHFSDDDDDELSCAGSMTTNQENGPASANTNQTRRSSSGSDVLSPLFPLVRSASLPTKRALRSSPQQQQKRKLRRTKTDTDPATVIIESKTPPPTLSAASTSSTLVDEMETQPEVNWLALEVPCDVWLLAQELYDQVKPRVPRTFAEICVAAKVSKREIGMYYKLMSQVLPPQYTVNERAKPAAFVERWCSVLGLPGWIPEVASRVYERADEMGIVQGKSPVSVSAASIWLVVWCFNYRSALGRAGFALPGIRRFQVCKTASVVIATLTSVFKLLLPHLGTLVDGYF